MPPKPPGAPDSDPAFQAALFAHQNGRLAEAEPLYEALIQRNRKHFPALVMLSALKAQKGEYAAAEQLIRNALKLQPNDLRALMQRAQILLAQERHDEAFAALGDVVAQNPAIPEAQANRGAILMLRKRYPEALECFDAALRIRPDFAPALCNRGNALQELNRVREALVAYEAALRLQPSNPEYLASRANCLYRLRRYDEALTDLNAALRLQPQNPDFLYNKGNILSQLKKLEEAFAAYDAAYRLRPDLDYLAGDRLFTKLNLCDWSNLDVDAESIVCGVEEGRAVARPFVMLGLASSTAQQVRCAKQFMQREFPPQVPLWRGQAYRHERIRIAYLSADFRDHPVAHLMAGVFERHDRARFEVSAYAFGPAEPTPLRRRLEAAFEHFHDVSETSDGDIAARMREHEIDIAIDLMGPTQNARPGILARRPAPVQVLYLGYAGSSGAPFIDHVLADSVVIPADQRALYPEKIVDLPDCFMATDSRRPIAADAPSRTEEGLPEQGFVFCAFSNSYKITPAMFDVWLQLLRDVPRSVLWLAATNARASDNLRRAAAAKQIAPERLVFARRHESNAVHLARYAHADLFLDTAPYGAHSTACEALWAGLPVLTVHGETFAGRVAASLLGCLGLPELVCGSLAAYKNAALRITADRNEARALKERVAQLKQTSPLFDTERFTRGLEASYLEVLNR